MNLFAEAVEVDLMGGNEMEAYGVWLERNGVGPSPGAVDLAEVEIVEAPFPHDHGRPAVLLDQLRRNMQILQGKKPFDKIEIPDGLRSFKQSGIEVWRETDPVVPVAPPAAQ